MSTNVTTKTIFKTPGIEEADRHLLEALQNISGAGVTALHRAITDAMDARLAAYAGFTGIDWHEVGEGP